MYISRQTQVEQERFLHEQDVLHRLGTNSSLKQFYNMNPNPKSCTVIHVVTSIYSARQPVTRTCWLLLRSRSLTYFSRQTQAEQERFLREQEVLHWLGTKS